MTTPAGGHTPTGFVDRLAHKIEVAEACSGVVSLRVEEARLLKDAAIQHDALANALEDFMRDHASKLDCDCPLCLRFGAVLRLAGRLAP